MDGKSAARARQDHGLIVDPSSTAQVKSALGRPGTTNPRMRSYSMTRSRVLDRRPAAAWRVGVPRRHDAPRVPAPQHDPARDDAFSRVLYERHGTVLLNFALRLCNGD